MFANAIYNTNEILGSFWRPDDYMAHVPTPRVIGKDASNADDTALSVSISEEGYKLAAANKATPAISPVDVIGDNNNQRTAKRYVYNGIEGTVMLLDEAI